MTMTESERRTRKARIDPKLKHAGWTTIMPFRPSLDPPTLAAADRIAAGITKAQQQVERTSQSVLAKAFRGDLLMGSIKEKQ